MQNFIQNLRYDLSASIVVFFVALPLCLGIALVSGVPLFSGIISGIIGGVVVGAVSRSPLGVSGPATGLAVIVFGYVATLGSFENFLVAVFLAGIIQIIMGMMRLGTIAYYFPSSVIKGMLAGIGVIIIIKQIPHALGYNTGMARDFEEFLDEGALITLQKTVNNFTPAAIIISIISMSLLLSWESLAKKYKTFSVIPGPLAVVIVGIFASNFMELAGHQIVQILVAENFSEFFSQFYLPNFDQLKNPQIYAMAMVIAIIASLETLLCVEATDKLDSLKRITPTNRELKAQGLGNIISGLIGGLPITQVIVRSSANITFGARSKSSAILHGFLLLISAIAIPNLLNMIPLSSLACILIMVGYKLAKPSLINEMRKLGFEQFLPFFVTIAGIVIFDLLKGVMFGMAISVLFILYNNFRNALSREHIEDKEGKNHEHVIRLAEEVSFLNKGAILQTLADIPENSMVIIDGSKSKFIDYDVVEIIQNFRVQAKSKNISLTVKGVNLKKI
ncbi:MAG: hypothetical protein A2887_00280 [Alphaproteobacteria bacterium RIFCSPLOWO2_01_FULL_40_26]|nr:MAG: hypothetical protein A3D15_06710 [Alphaproteobacteria bacterium RIFCSPHIGHO2_02_FULL_40_34]OFW94626.1 MAG: hypothetical protein A2887_00280 [Alphaproteobacteria bacterium RIFCSPLOWO2_01_FULL_40_26]OFX10094.1 MAG: hypothetical protein A3H30_04740 [Alphaproteobacteria bacterium RIFCSPLOWO2_02_FULL_40_19]OFX11724.1 MAG: hypothetical protein A3G22_04330 [Alphaproteobacteria bacterium RIFCSPLOWO2_12_FULL_40_11]